MRPKDVFCCGAPAERGSPDWRLPYESPYPLLSPALLLWSFIFPSLSFTSSVSHLSSSHLLPTVLGLSAGRGEPPLTRRWVSLLFLYFCLSVLPQTSRLLPSGLGVPAQLPNTGASSTAQGLGIHRNNRSSESGISGAGSLSCGLLASNVGAASSYFIIVSMNCLVTVEWGKHPFRLEMKTR